jgi:hypothetical protein
MEFLDFNPAKKMTHSVKARIVTLAEPTLSGKIVVTFNSNWHATDGPYLEFDESIRRVRISHTSFKPRWQDIVWDPNRHSLTVKGDGYGFSLVFSSVG